MIALFLNIIWGLWVWAARTYLIHVLRTGIQVGQLVVRENGAIVGTFGHASKTAQPVYITVRDDRFWTHVFLFSDVGFSEAYMLQYFDLRGDDIKAALDLWLDNRYTLGAFATPLYRLLIALSGAFNYVFGQTLSAARKNAIVGYDVSNAFFESWLSSEMMYSNALFGPEEGGPRGDKAMAEQVGFPHHFSPLSSEKRSGSGDSTPTLVESESILGVPHPASLAHHLESAQIRKLHHILTKARVKPGDRVLEFGTGWGGCAIEAAVTFGCEIDTLTLSVEQAKLAEKRAKEAGVGDRVRVHVLDYRLMPKEWKGQFDAFVSIEMLEHVGAKWHPTFFKLIDWALKDKDAAASFCVTTQPESRYSSGQYTDFGRKYIWPGTVLPAVSAVIAAANKGNDCRMSFESVEDQTPHYARVMREWKYRFNEKWDSEIVDIVQGEYPELEDPVKLEAFRRKWLYIFDYAEAGFARAYAGSHMFTLVRDDMVTEPCA